MGPLQLPPVHQLYLSLHLNYAAHSALSQNYKTSHVNQKDGFVRQCLIYFDGADESNVTTFLGGIQSSFQQNNNEYKHCPM